MDTFLYTAVSFLPMANRATPHSDAVLEYPVGFKPTITGLQPAALVNLAMDTYKPAINGAPNGWTRLNFTNNRMTKNQILPKIYF